MNEEYLLEEMDDSEKLLRRVDSIQLSLDDLDNELDCLHIETATIQVAIGAEHSMRILLQMIENMARKEYDEVQQKYITLVNQKNPEESKETYDEE